MKPKTLLYLSHRWLGIAMCLFLAMWCASGMVMMYVGFPELTQDEYYAGLEPLAAENINYGPNEILTKTSSDTPIEKLLLTSSGKRPVYLLKKQGTAWQGMYADNGEHLHPLTAPAATDVALAFYLNLNHKPLPNTESPFRAEHLGQLDMDQWTVSNGLNPYRPLHKVAINDAAGTVLYISALTGQVVRDTHRNERILNWLGANLHWIYPVQLRKHRGIWANVIIVLSLLGLTSVLTGAVIGFMRLRLKRRYASGARTPYRGVHKYHHIIGLLSLIFLVTFLLSGLMSMNPWGVFSSSTSYAEQRQNYRATENWGLENGALQTPVLASPNALREFIQQNDGLPIKQLSWHWIAGESHLALHRSRHDIDHALSPNDTSSLQNKIKANISQLIPTSTIVSHEQLIRYDLYYYSHHDRHRPLPVMRVKFDDPESTWFHIDMQTGDVLNRLTSKRRVERWLYNGLHTFDFKLFIANRPVWDIWMIALCSIGLIFATTSLIIARQRLRQKKLLF